MQVGSHYHFFEVNNALRFDRAAAYGMRLNIPAGTSVRFEPGEEKEVAAGGIRRRTDRAGPQWLGERTTIDEAPERKS